ncbi:polyribonucleotide nucleotidyltransferase [candidate division WWE3 bacterium CG10_big_fil_rev_8_21_14_0_10_32_10]|uniref:Polyribonucleotide nucleotidyltransferase n=1 Tax=candidate division WWE3 bacterium CG10_big_fil_rev_8_21_14_0_10_32_10 TaxID=1975090 RepID=A0A2H0RB44_UNCKA|nr:MAG: polyribonucleotide nucleotidyltransferase [candidate division WWE3 bacterium CG10_big_fil_rev_8_21_14_0_10_32_10]
MNENIIESSINFQGREIKLQTGKLAPQADMSVLAQMGETTVLATVVAKKATEDPGFLPLTINYEEKLYAGGLIKSARWVKREGRPSDENTVTARLMDHAIRPLFPKDYRDEVQVIVTVLSVDEENNPEILSMIAASAVLSASSLPFSGTFGSLQIGYIDNEFVISPKVEDLNKSDLNLIVSYLDGEKVQAMEASCNLLPDEKVKEAIKLGYSHAKNLIDFINDFAKKVNKPKEEYVSFSAGKEMYNEAKSKFDKQIQDLVYNPKNKEDYWNTFDQIKAEAKKYFEEKYGEDYSENEVVIALDKIQSMHIRNLALDDKKRIDGRALDEVRKISSEVNILPRVHGSALFSRELTQVLSVTTLGSPANTLLRETLYGEEESRYFHHYVALGFSTGEPSRLGSPGRREIGHGMLAQKALVPVLPSLDEFPYVIRVVSEVLSQNGSSSMASVCGSSLSLMDAGVPIKDIVGGISVGLITDDKNEKFEILTDIQGAEDFSGFMDYKMAGTKTGVSAIQMDIKLAGIPLSLFDTILDRSKSARLHIISEMEKTIQKPNTELKEHAPKIQKVTIAKDEIGLIIGSGGKTIKEIQEKTGATLDIIEEEDKGIVAIMSTDIESIEKAVNFVKKLIEKPEVGKVYDGVVTKIFDFGALVEFLPGKEGLLHVSEMSDEYVKNVSDVIKENQEVQVKLKEIGDRGKFVLTKKFGK